MVESLQAVVSGDALQPKLSIYSLLPEWRSNLSALISSAFHKPFVWSSWDCGLWGADVIKATTGIDELRPQFEGKYHDEDSAMAFIKSQGYADILDIFAKHTAGEIPLAMARYGDLVFVPGGSTSSMPACTVCLGERLGGLTLQGYTTFPRRLGKCAFRIGPL